MKDEKLKYFGDSPKNPTFKGGSRKPIYRGGLPKNGGLGQFANLRGGLTRKREGLIH